MTLLGKIVITAGIVIFTISSILWITESDWRYFAGGAAIFGGTLLTSIVLSIETKTSSNGNGNGSAYHRQTNPNSYPTYPHISNEYPSADESWRPPSTPAPDENTTDDPFLNPPR